MMTYVYLGFCAVMMYLAGRVHGVVGQVGEMVTTVKKNGVNLTLGSTASQTPKTSLTASAADSLDISSAKQGWTLWLWSLVNPLEHWRRLIMIVCGVLLGVIFFARKKKNPVKEALRAERYGVILKILAAITVLVNYDVYMDIVRSLQLHRLLRSLFAWFAPPPKVDTIPEGFVRGPTQVPLSDSAMTTATTPTAAVTPLLAASSDAALIAEAKARSANNTWDIASHQPLEVDGEPIFGKDVKSDALTYAYSCARLKRVCVLCWEKSRYELLAFLVALTIGCGIGWAIMYWSAHAKLAKKVKRQVKFHKHLGAIVNKTTGEATPYYYVGNALRNGPPVAVPVVEARTKATHKIIVDYDDEDDEGKTASRRDVTIVNDNGELVSDRLTAKQFREQQRTGTFITNVGQFMPINPKLWSAAQDDEDPGEWHPESRKTDAKKAVAEVAAVVEAKVETPVVAVKAVPVVKAEVPTVVVPVVAPVAVNLVPGPGKRRRNRSKAKRESKLVPIAPKVAAVVVAKAAPAAIKVVAKGYQPKIPTLPREAGVRYAEGRPLITPAQCAVVAPLASNVPVVAAKVVPVTIEARRRVEEALTAPVAVKEAAIKGSVMFDQFDPLKNLVHVGSMDGVATGEGFCVGNDLYTAWHVVDPSEKCVSIEAKVWRTDKIVTVTFKKLGKDMAVSKGAKPLMQCDGMQSVGFSQWTFHSGAQTRIWSRVYKSFQGEVVSFQDGTRAENASDRVFMSYAMTTFPGMSGCPVWVDGHLVGVHVGSIPAQMLNYAELLTPHLNL